MKTMQTQIWHCIDHLISKLTLASKQNGLSIGIVLQKNLKNFYIVDNITTSALIMLPQQ